jgi:hypothetical protein
MARFNHLFANAMLAPHSRTIICRRMEVVLGTNGISATSHLQIRQYFMIIRRALKGPLPWSAQAQSNVITFAATMCRLHVQSARLRRLMTYLGCSETSSGALSTTRYSKGTIMMIRKQNVSLRHVPHVAGSLYADVIVFSHAPCQGHVGLPFHVVSYPS